MNFKILIFLFIIFLLIELICFYFYFWKIDNKNFNKILPFIKIRKEEIIKYNFPFMCNKIPSPKFFYSKENQHIVEYRNLIEKRNFEIETTICNIMLSKREKIISNKTNINIRWINTWENPGWVEKLTTKYCKSINIFFSSF
jgi:hypothetical protein